MPRGKRNVDPADVSEIDLLTLRPSLEAIANGATSRLTNMQLARLFEAVVAQYRTRLSPNDRSSFDRAARTTIEHAIGLSGITWGGLLVLESIDQGETSNVDDLIENQIYEIGFVASHYNRKMACQIINMMDVLAAKIRAVGSGGGRPVRPFVVDSDEDWRLLGAALERMTPERGQIEDWCEEIRRVVVDAAQGKTLERHLGAPGDVKGQIDAYTKRLSRLAKRLAGSSTN